MIGLKRHTVQIVEHHHDWAALAVEACQEMRRAGGEFLSDVQHVGSTAVPGLPAKPILDIVAAVTTLDNIPELVERLTGIGYINRGDRGDNGGHLFIRESSPDVRTIHLHVVEHNGTQWKNDLRFRDLLRQNPDIRKQYAELKQKLSKRFPNDRELYTTSKHDFIRGILGIKEAEQVAAVDA